MGKIGWMVASCLIGSFNLIAAEVISVNFSGRAAYSCAGTVAVPNLADANLPGEGWNNTDVGTSTGTGTGTNTLTQVWNGLDVLNTGTAVLTYEASGYESCANNSSYPYLHYALKDGTHNGVQGPTVSVTGIPYETYDVIIYMMGAQGTDFYPYRVNGKYYMWDSATSSTVRTFGTTQVWGEALTATAELGLNAIRVTGLQGDLTIQGPYHGPTSDTYVHRGTLAAFQIVKSDATPIADPDFQFEATVDDGLPSGSFSGWSDTAWRGTGDGSYQQRIAPFHNAYEIKAGNYCPYLKVYYADAFSMSVIADITDISSATGEGEMAVIACWGDLRANGNALLLGKYGTGVRLVMTYSEALGSTYNYDSAIIDVSDIPQGYHLYTVTWDPSSGMSLKVDNADAVYCLTADARTVPTTYGLQFGAGYGNNATTGNYQIATGLAIWGVFGWNKALSDAEQAEVYENYKSVLGTPVNYNFFSDIVGGHGGTVLNVPTMDSENDAYALGGRRGTVNVPATSFVNLPSICMGNSTTNLTLTFNVYGTVHVDSESTTPNVYSEKDSLKGVLFGNEKGNMTENIYGVLAATNAYIELIRNHESSTMTIDGGRVTARGLYAANAKGIINLQNGGLLEVADIEASTYITFNFYQGTLRAVESGDLASGWTTVSSLSFNDTATGATIDLNGKAIAFTGSASGSGKVTIVDSSAAGTGVMKFGSLAAFSGSMVVESGTLDIGVARPNGIITFAENANLVLSESVADSGDRIAMPFLGTPASITLYRADGTTLVDSTQISIVSEGGYNYISYPSAEVPVVSGKSCWYDFEFEDYGYTSIGYNTQTLSREQNKGRGGTVVEGDFRDEHNVYTASLMYMTPVYPSEWSAAIYGTIPKLEDGVLMDFGRSSGLIALVGGSGDNEVKLVCATNNTAYITLATMSAPNATSVPHLYVFVKRDKEVDIYLDGALWTTYASEESLSIANGFQLGAVHGTAGNTGLKDFSVGSYDNDTNNVDLVASYVDMLRMYECALSEKAIMALSAEFPYVSLKGTYTRTLTAAEEDWVSEGAWTVSYPDGTTATADAPVDGATVILHAATACTLSVDSSVYIHLEGLTIDGSYSLTFSTAKGAMIANEGRTVINTGVTLSPEVTVAGGPLAIATDARLTFDYSTFDLAIDAANGSMALTGLSAETADIRRILPTDRKGRTFAIQFNSGNSCWEISYERGPLSILWQDPEGVWTTGVVWKNLANADDAGYLDGDTVVFGDMTGVTSQQVEVVDVKYPGGLVFTNQVAGAETDYNLIGNDLHLTSIADFGAGAVYSTNRIYLTKADITVGAAEKPQQIMNLRGTINNFTLAAGTSEARSNFTAGNSSGSDTLYYDGTTVIGANSDFTFAGIGNSNIRGFFLTDESSALHKIGTGTVYYNATNVASYVINGTLEISEGTFEVDREFTSVTATAANPIQVNGSGRLKIPYGTGAAQNRLPTAAFVDVSSNGVLEVQGQNPFKRDSSDSPTVICHDGGTLQANGVNTAYDVHLWSVQLNSGNLYFAGTTADWNNRALDIDGDGLVSAGESRAYMDEGCPNRLVADAIDVQSGTLEFGIPTDGDLVKKGAGTLTLTGSGGAYTRIVDVQEGYIGGTEALVTNTDTLTMAAKTGFDLSARTDAFAIGSLAVTGTGTVYVRTGERQLEIGDCLISWSDGDPAASLKYSFSPDTANSFGLNKHSNGLYVQAGFYLIVR